MKYETKSTDKANYKAALEFFSNYPQSTIKHVFFSVTRGDALKDC